MNETNSDGILGWHFLPSDGRLRFPPRTLVTVGETLRLPAGKQPILYKRGFHAAERPLDALSSGAGPIICRVRLSGKISRPRISLVASECTVLRMADASELLHEFACDCAERALTEQQERGMEPDARCWAAPATKRCWLRSESTDADLAAARDAAEAAWHDFDTAWILASCPAAAYPRKIAAYAAFCAADADARNAAITTKSAALTAMHAVGSSAASWSKTWEELDADLEARLLALLGLDEGPR